TDSTRVYQGTVGSVDAKLIQGLERITVGDLKPDITFILDVPVDQGLARASRRRGEDQPDRFEGEPVEVHEKLRYAVRMRPLSEPNRCVLTDARAERAAVAEKIWKVVSDRLEPATAPMVLEDAIS